MTGLGGNDVLLGGNGADTLLGGDGNDWLGGGAGNDRLEGGNHSDILVGGLGVDVIGVSECRRWRRHLDWRSHQLRLQQDGDRRPHHRLATKASFTAGVSSIGTGFTSGGVTYKLNTTTVFDDDVTDTSSAAPASTGSSPTSNPPPPSASKTPTTPVPKPVRWWIFRGKLASNARFECCA